EGLKRLSQQEGATLFIALMAAFKVLLMRYSGEEDVVVGTVIANRTREEVGELIGFFVNTLVMRTDLSGKSEFQRDGQAGARGCSGRLCPSGGAVREAGGGDQSGARPEPEPLVSGHDGAAEHEPRRIADQGGEGEGYSERDRWR